MNSHNNSPKTPRRPRFNAGRTSGLFGRWIRCPRPLPAAGGEMKRLANDPLRT